MKKAELTVLIQKDKSGWYVGQLEEFPAVISQGENIEQLKENLLDALNLLLDTQKKQLKKTYLNKKILRQKIQIV